MAYSGDDILEFSEQREQGMIGVRYIDEIHCLATRLRRRKIGDRGDSSSPLILPIRGQARTRSMPDTRYFATNLYSSSPGGSDLPTS